MFACFRVGYFSSQQTEYKWPPSDILKHLGKAGVSWVDPNIKPRNKMQKSSFRHFPQLSLR